MKKDTGRKIVLWAAVLLFVAMAGHTMAAVKKGPYLIYPGNNTEMQVLWQLDSASSHLLQWGEDTGYSEGSETPTVYGDNQYKHTITGLTPGVKYYYEVQGVGSGSFFAAPPDDATNLKFLAYGDTRTNPDIHDSVNAAMINAYTSDPDYQTFTTLTGDWVNNGDDEAQWTLQFFGRSRLNSREMQANLPINGCIGNHEESGSLYEKYWPYPYESGGRYWSFDYGPAHVVVLVLTSESGGGANLGSAQREWLEADLAASDKEWKFLQFHAPIYSAGDHENNEVEQEYIQNLCVTHGVDMVFNGHNHYYSRADVSQDGGPHVQHITTGGGGAPFHTPNASYPYVVRVSAVNHFCKIDIQGKDLIFQAINTGNGNVIDSFTVSHEPEEDIVPPTPDPMEWLTFPHATGRFSISMTAETAFDLSGVEYYFDRMPEGGDNDSGWQSSSTYEDTGLTPGTEYTYKVKARDTSPNFNETGFSDEESATTNPPDTSAPDPNAMTWATPPESSGVYSVLMTATIASDPGGEDPEAVEYYFGCTAGGGNDSDWQDDNVYENRELSENTLYTYRVKARDKSPNQNETEWSGEMSARTDIDFPDPGDLNRDRVVDILDLGLLGLQLGQIGCGVEDFWCDFADTNKSTDVDTTDMWTVAYNWMQGYTIDIGFDTFDSEPNDTRIADLPDWYARESSTSEIQNIGVGGSQGFTSDPSVLTWSAGDGSINGFNWSSMETGDTVVLSMDFEYSDGFEDDAIGWIIGYDSSDYLHDYFQVRLDEVGYYGTSYGIEGFWDVEGPGSATVTIAEISDTLTTGSWYRLRAEFTKLTATSVSIDAEAWLLDDTGAEVRKIAAGSVPDTSTLGSDEPDAKFFENGVWPAFRNDAGNSGACDNPYYGFMPTH